MSDLATISIKAPARVVVLDAAPPLVINVPKQGFSGQDGNVLGAETFEHLENSPVNPWIIDHMLNAYPSVTVIDSANAELFADVTWPTVNQVVITFGGPASGRATLTA